MPRHLWTDLQEWWMGTCQLIYVREEGEGYVYIKRRFEPCQRLCRPLDLWSLEGKWSLGTLFVEATVCLDLAKGHWGAWALEKHVLDHENILISFVTSYLALCESFIFISRLVMGVFTNFIFVFNNSVREFMNVLCSRVGSSNHLQVIRNSSIIFIWRIGWPHRPTQQCIMRLFPFSLSSSSMANGYGKF